MAEEFVGRTEFENLKSNVDKIQDNVSKIQDDMIQNARTLVSIDGKVDIIKERLTSADEISNLKLKPLDERVSALEDSQKWLRRAVAGSCIGILIGVIVEVIRLIK